MKKFIFKETKKVGYEDNLEKYILDDGKIRSEYEDTETYKHVYKTEKTKTSFIKTDNYGKTFLLLSSEDKKRLEDNTVLKLLNYFVIMTEEAEKLWSSFWAYYDDDLEKTERLERFFGVEDDWDFEDDFQISDEWNKLFWEVRDCDELYIDETRINDIHSIKKSLKTLKEINVKLDVLDKNKQEIKKRREQIMEQRGNEELFEIITSTLEEKIFKNNNSQREIKKIVSWLKRQDVKKIEEDFFLNEEALDFDALWDFIKENYYKIKKSNVALPSKIKE